MNIDIQKIEDRIKELRAQADSLEHLFKLIHEFAVTEPQSVQPVQPVQPVTKSAVEACPLLAGLERGEKKEEPKYDPKDERFILPLTFSGRLTQNMRQSRTTDVKIAASCGVSVPTIKLWRYGTTLPHYDRVKMLCQLLYEIFPETRKYKNYWENAMKRKPSDAESMAI